MIDSVEAGQACHATPCRSPSTCRRSSRLRVTVCVPAMSPIAIEARFRLLGSIGVTAPSRTCRAGHAADEVQPVVEARVVDEARVGRLRRVTCPAPWRKISTGLVSAAGGVPPSSTSYAGRHQRRLDHHRRPVRVQFLEQRREAGHVRAGHRSAAVQVEQRGRISRRRDACQDVLARGDQVWLQHVAVTGAERSTRGERRGEWRRPSSTRSWPD